MAYVVSAEVDRLRELAIVFGGAAQGISAITTNFHTPEVTASLIGSATGAACHTGARNARSALSAVGEHYDTLHSGTHTSADMYESSDTEHAHRIDALRQSL